MKKTILSCLFAATAICSIPSHAETTLRAFIPIIDTRPEAKLVEEEFVDKVSELSNGELKVQTYYAGGLGFEVRDLLRHMRKGTVDIGMIVGVYYSRDAEELSLLLADGGITDATHLPEFYPLYMDRYERSLERWRVKPVGVMEGLVFDHSIFCKEPVTSLEQLKTKKLRTWTKHQLETFKSLGVSAQMIPQEELYVSLQTGVVDCAVYLGEVSTLMGIHEVAPYETYFLPFIGAPSALGISDKAWKKLTEEQQKIILEAAQNLQAKSHEKGMEFNNNRPVARGARTEKGIQITEGFSDADLATLTKAFRENWKTMAHEVGPESEEIVDYVLEKNY
ncbi:TRAP transporter substrate-binding protein DctP [Marinobacterium sp. YM272]|uniref:TRAP transporter substrate-binding protein DctP n=1 Tax=Marinobacterium sp. YM272 TaxID=3421654 RepID=UPI003D7FBA15